MSTTLRRATADDLATVVMVDDACFDTPWPAASWEAELSRVFATVTLAFEGDAVVGMACDWCVAGQAHLLRLATVPQARGRGVGRALLDDVLARAAATECEEVWLEVGARNGAARRLYARAGFVEVARRRGYYRDPCDDAVVMRRSMPHGEPR